jgi:hypothetical protein
MLQSNPMKPKRLCFCIAGWHFSESVYAAGCESGIDLFVISHQSSPRIPEPFFQSIPADHIFQEPNLGYDWGCYQQFIARGIWKSYDVIFFMHDDLFIRNLDFIPHSLELIRSGAQVVGNGLNSPHVAWTRTHLQCYAHSGWLPPSTAFEHQTVRGSFFAITASALQKVRHFEIFWDPKRVYIRFGNHSLIATCGRLTALFGEGCIAFLGSDYRTSPYILEEERGGQEHFPPTMKQRLAVYLYKELGRQYVAQRMQSKGVNTFIRSLGTILEQLDGVKRDSAFYGLNV